mmetsp:Transcript_133146/g.284629  ORF Transcript_133146/g.284629 Transcript_133146/m.284629 type:complete len:202 (-) Transcript_133146:1656-2261(-)
MVCPRRVSCPSQRSTFAPNHNLAAADDRRQAAPPHAHLGIDCVDLLHELGDLVRREERWRLFKRRQELLLQELGRHWRIHNSVFVGVGEESIHAFQEGLLLEDCLRAKSHQELPELWSIQLAGFQRLRDDVRHRDFLMPLRNLQFPDPRHGLVDIVRGHELLNGIGHLLPTLIAGAPSGVLCCGRGRRGRAAGTSRRSRGC